MGIRNFSKWLQGSSGSMDPGVAEYNSENAQVYENGTLGPRPGWLEISTTAGTRVHDPATDTLRGFQWIRTTDDSEEYLVLMFTDTSDSNIRKYDLLALSDDTWESGGSIVNSSITGNLRPPEFVGFNKIMSWFDGFALGSFGPYLTTTTTTTEGTPALPQIALTHVTAVASTTEYTVNDATYLTEGAVIDLYQPDGTSRIADRTISNILDTTITTDVATGVAVGDLIMLDGTTINADGYPAAVTLYRERAYYWGYASYPGRVYFSQPADHTHVHLYDYFDVNTSVEEEGGAVTGMYPVKNALMITRKDDRWMVLTGTSPENGTLRELGTDPVPDFRGGVIVDNQVYFLNRSGHGVVVATPSAVDNTELHHLSPLAHPGGLLPRPTNSFQSERGVGDDVGGDMFLPAQVGSTDPIYAVERANNVFNLSRWDLDARADILFTKGAPGVMYGYIDEGTTHSVFSRDFTLNRPANSGDSKSQALGSEQGSTSAVVQLGETLASEGTIIRPVKVVVDLDYWKGGQYSAPALTVDGTVKGTEAATPEDDIVTQVIATTTWADIPADLPYKRRVAIPLPSTQFGTRFDIKLTFDNLALDAVQVYYDEQRDPR